MYCTDLNCIFVHIPKTAGKSIEYFFLSRRNLSWDQRHLLLLKKNNDQAKGPERLAHLTAEEYVRLGYIPEQVFIGCYRFSFVRNPWARMVSEYMYRGYSNQMSFNNFVAKGIPEQDMTDISRHLLPQYNFLYDSTGELMVNFVGRFESLQADFDKVCDQLNIQPSSLPHIDNPGTANSTVILKLRNLAWRIQKKKHLDYESYYDTKTQQLVAKLYEKDIDTFCYTFKS